MPIRKKNKITSGFYFFFLPKMLKKQDICQKCFVNKYIYDRLNNFNNKIKYFKRNNFSFLKINTKTKPLQIGNENKCIWKSSSASY